MSKINKLFIVIVWTIAMLSVMMNIVYVNKIDELENRLKIESEVMSYESYSRN